MSHTDDYYQYEDLYFNGDEEQQQQQEIEDYGDREHQEIEDYSNEGQHQEIEDYGDGEHQEIEDGNSEEIDEQQDKETQENGQAGRFSYAEIHDYLDTQSYPSGYTKADKLALRKRSKFFKVKDGHLYYTGKGKCTILE